MTINYELKDILMLLFIFAINIGVGILGHIIWNMDKKLKTNLLDLWQASGAKERAEFAVNLCRSHGSLLCGTLKNLRKCNNAKF